MTRSVLALVLLASLTAALQAQTVTAPLAASSWEVVPLLKTPLTTTFDSVRLTVPDLRSGYTLNYLMTVPKTRPDGVDNQQFWLQPLTDLTTLVVRWRITVTKGTPSFDYGYGPDNPCVGAAAAHVFLWQPGFDWYDEFARWWGQGDYAVPLVPGYSTIRIPLTPDAWISVYGRQGSASDPDALRAFQRTLANPGSVGLTFGGGCYFGHGVTTTGGTATFELVDYHVEKPMPRTCPQPLKGAHGEVIPCCC